jgi:hypothetical protein
MAGARNGIAFHHKQNGGFRGKDAGCLVDGHRAQALSAFADGRCG